MSGTFIDGYPNDPDFPTVSLNAETLMPETPPPANRIQRPTVAPRIHLSIPAPRPRLVLAAIIIVLFAAFLIGCAAAAYAGGLFE